MSASSYYFCSFLGRQTRPDGAGFQDVAQITRQPVAEVGGAGGDAAQGHAQGQARAGALQPLAGGGQALGRQRPFAAQRAQRQARVAQRAADPDVVAHARAVAPQRLAGGHLAEHGHAQVQRPGRGVAAHQRAGVGVGQGEQAAGQGRQPGVVARALGRQRQRQRAGQRLGTAGGQVAQVDGQRLVAERGGVDVGKEVAALHQHVGAHGQLHAGGRLQEGAVVADAQHDGLRY